MMNQEQPQARYTGIRPADEQPIQNADSEDDGGASGLLALIQSTAVNSLGLIVIGGIVWAEVTMLERILSFGF